jgi:hypothetical protein
VKILKLEVENVKKVKAVTVRPDPNDPVVIVRGNNAQGKSSLLDAMRYAFEGKGSHPPRVVREGTTEAHVEIETDDLIVIRRWNGHEHEDGPSTEVEVRSKERGKLKSPQAVLDHLYGNLAFDPLAFTKLKQDAQALEWKKVVGVDTDAIDLESEKVFSERTETNRKIKDGQARLEALPHEAPAQTINLSKLLAEQESIAAAQRAANVKRSERDAAMRRVADAGEHVKAAASAVAAAEKALAEAKGAHAAAQTRLANAQAQAATADNACDDLPDESAQLEQLISIRKQIEQASTLAVENERWASREKLAAELKALEVTAKSQTKRLAELDLHKTQLLAKAPVPIEGLTYTPSGLKFKGLPLEQASSAEQLRVSVAMGMAANPKLRVMMSREGSLLDDQSVEILREMCRDRGFQFWLEVVGENGPAAVVIREGSRAPAKLGVVKGEGAADVD